MVKMVKIVVFLCSKIKRPTRALYKRALSQFPANASGDNLAI